MRDACLIGSDGEGKNQKDTYPGIHVKIDHHRLASSWDLYSVHRPWHTLNDKKPSTVQ